MLFTPSIFFFGDSTLFELIDDSPVDDECRIEFLLYALTIFIWLRWTLIFLNEFFHEIYFFWKGERLVFVKELRKLLLIKNVCLRLVDVLGVCLRMFILLNVWLEEESFPFSKYFKLKNHVGFLSVIVFEYHVGECINEMNVRWNPLKGNEKRLSLAENTSDGNALYKTIKEISKTNEFP